MNLVLIHEPIPKQFTTEVFEKSSQCNEAIRTAAKHWARFHGFTELWLGWWERDGEVIHILRTSGVEIIR